eukprot:CAMPEP_0113663236 /NCGR_PEP_ID=MMETSP0038_2-20120614/1025_1 /TAXON_ID=2898 /ORGANISM="Cryptomonas paramecium" /LENGTH=90 /DNA_ID=CAMNT_0000578231 /DNA_START=73 /DNA_END=342 /DNA_ORIENTATION=+ /assembly_acc=CAM_ASM_000170
MGVTASEVKGVRGPGWGGGGHGAGRRVSRGRRMQDDAEGRSPGGLSAPGSKPQGPEAALNRGPGGGVQPHEGCGEDVSPHAGPLHVISPG